jgi:hypothetical protein
LLPADSHSAIIMQMFSGLFLNRGYFVVLPDFKFYSVTCLFDVVVLAAFTLQTRSFLIFALHLLFSFQDAFAKIIS